MRYLLVKNWEKFQHYKDRNPPWIKLYRWLLDDYEFSQLQDETKAHLMLIWLLASHTGGRVPADPKYLAAKIGATSLPDLSKLVDSGWLIVEGSGYRSEPAMPGSSGADQVDGGETPEEPPKPPPEQPATAPPSVPERDASRVIADRKHDASDLLRLARSREAETEAEKRERQRGARADARDRPPGPTDAHRTMAKDLQVDCDLEWSAFWDRVESKGEWFKPSGWDAAFRNWLRQERKFAERDGRVASPAPKLTTASLGVRSIV